MSLRTKLTLVLMVFSIVPVVVVGLIEEARSRRTLETHLGAQSLQLTRLSLQRITEYLYSKFEDVRSWSHRAALEPTDNPEYREHVNSILADMIETYGEYHYALILDKTGRVIAASDSHLVGASLADHPAFQAALGGQISVQDVAFDTLALAYSLVIAAPIPSDDTSQDVSGVLLAAVKWQKVGRMITSLRIGGREQTESDHLMLLNHTGLVISCFSRDEMFTTNLIEQGMRSSIEAARGQEGYLTETSEHGLPSFSAYTYQRQHRDMPLLGWHLVLLQSPRRVFAPIYSLRETMIYTLLGVVVLLGVVSYLVGRRISKPILTIASAAQIVGKGQFDTRVTVESHDEIGVLAESFNTMAGELKESRHHLQVARARLVRAREAERRRFATDLHDSIGQALVAIQLSLQTALETLHKQADKKTVQAIADARRQSTELVHAIRDICYNMYPPTLEVMGVTPSLRDLVKSCNSAGLRTELQCDLGADTARFARDVEITLFRVAQEATTNALRHSQATRLQLELSCEDGWVRLAVIDDGKGFTPDAPGSSGLGLANMQERADAVGGRPSITSQPGKTIVTLLVPADSPADIDPP